MPEARHDLQYLSVQLSTGVDSRVINYNGLTGEAAVGDQVLVNTTATDLKLGTGGFDYVITNLSRLGGQFGTTDGHIIKGRYLPCQHSVLTLEEQSQYAHVWEASLERVPVLVGQLHSQMLPSAQGLKSAGFERVVYIMTDCGALRIGLSNDVLFAKKHSLVAATITCGQASGGDAECVTLHSALLAAVHIFGADAIIVCQGPGNAGTGTKFGFGGVEMAQNIDIVNKLNGSVVAIARCSSADSRPRHRDLSHHTRTALAMTYSDCLVALPRDLLRDGIENRHRVTWPKGGHRVVHFLLDSGVVLRSMGRTYFDDPLFFEAAAVAGLAARHV